VDETREHLRLTEAEREAWETDGFFTRHAVFEAEEVEQLRRAAESVAARAAETAPADRYAIDGNVYRETPMGGHSATVQLEHRSGSQTVRVVEPVHMHDAAFEALVDDPRIVEPMRGLVGSDRVAIFTDKMNLKRPREGSSFAWHQDSPYWTHFCDHVDRLPNVLVALDDAHEGNGCFRVIRGSHTRGCLPGQQGVGVLGPLFTHPEAFDLDDQVPAVVPAGSLVFFSPHTVHGSEPNESSEPRRALVLTYQPADLRMFKIDRVRNAGRPAAAQGQL
jgi:ectoine hydroxylase